MTELQPLGYGRADAQLLVELLPILNAQINAASLKTTFGQNSKERRLAFPFTPEDLAVFLVWVIGSPPLHPDILRLAKMLRADPERAAHPLAEALERVADQVAELEARYLYPDSFRTEIETAYNARTKAMEAAVRRAPGVRPADDDDVDSAQRHLRYLWREQKTELDHWLALLQSELEAGSSPMPGPFGHRIESQHPREVSGEQFGQGEDDIRQAGADAMSRVRGLSPKVAGHQSKPRRKREDVLTPIIRDALAYSEGGNWAFVYELLARWAMSRKPPLVRDAGPLGIEYSDRINDGTKFLTRDALRQRVERLKAAAAEES